MKKLTKKFGVLITLCLSLNMIYATTYISAGAQSGTWYAARGPYIVQGDIWVQTNNSLTIESGTTVEFYGDVSVPSTSHLIIEDACQLKFGGVWFYANNTWYYDGYRIYVVGEFDAGQLGAGQTLFTKLNGYDGWGGIIFDNSNSNNNSSLFNCRVEFALKVNDYNALLYEQAGALYVEGYNNLVVENCYFEYNEAYYGSAVYCLNSDVSFTECQFNMNLTTFYGGAIYNSGGGLVFDYCIFEENEAEYGGAVFCDAGNINFSQCGFIFNIADEDGGALYFTQATVDFSDHSYISNNTATNGNGGAVYIENLCTISFILSKITGNSANSNGGAFYNYNSDLQLINCLIVNNQCGGDGGGIYSFDNLSPASEIILNNNTIADNIASDGMQIFSDATGNMQLMNNIIWGTQSNDLNYTLSSSVNSPMFDHCCISDQNLSATPNAYGTFNDDPMFADVDYRVHGQTSPCIDAGNNNVTPIGALDLDGMDRFNNGDQQNGDEIDIGAYENQNGQKPPIMQTINHETQVPNFKINNNFLTVSFENQFKRIEIISSDGKVVFMKNIYYENPLTIDLSGFSDGIYFLKTIDEKLIKTFKFVVNQ